jgi:glycosyltransferase involved in cell wall biosynthesis
MNPLFSIIIPTYNRATLLSDTIKSVQNQTYTKWECIVVDDGSTDNTKEIVESLILKDNRVKYVYQENAERSAARNNGIHNSSGDYICFLDSDDLFEENHLDLLAKEINENSDTKFFFSGSSTLHNGNISVNKHEIYDGSPDYFIFNSVIPARVCILSSLLEKFKFDTNIVIVEDTVLWTYLHLNFKTKQLDLTGAIYRWHDDNSVNISKNCFLPRLNGLKRMFSDPIINSKITLKSRKIALANCYYGIAKYYEYKRNFFKMCFWSIMSIFTDSKSPQTKAKLYMIYAFFRKNNI